MISTGILTLCIIAMGIIIFLFGYAVAEVNCQKRLEYIKFIWDAREVAMKEKKE